MTCGSVMTPNPSCCLPGDSVSTAARIMKQQDVGPVLVVSDHNEMRLVGIVTDRDIAIEVVAEGRDPYSTRVDSIMSTDPVTCAEDEDVILAVKRMADYQVRRLPVVDEQNRVLGIISQADIARNASEDQVGEMVEEISQPWGIGEWPEGRYEGERTGRRSAGLEATSALAIGALCVGFGAGLMFMFDPSRGKKRRTQLREKGNELWRQRSEMLKRTRSAIADRTESLVSATRSKLTSEPQKTEEPWRGESEYAGQTAPGTVVR